MLAGGRASRLGEPKALAQLGGRSLIEWPLEAARAAGLDPLVVAKASTPLPEDLSVEVLVEPDEPQHPLAGLIHVLERGAPVVALACDDPFVTPTELVRLAGSAGTAVFGDDPLPGRYGPESLPLLREALAREASFRSALAEILPTRLEPRGRGSINTPGELAAARAHVSSQGMPRGTKAPRSWTDP